MKKTMAAIALALALSSAAGAQSAGPGELVLGVSEGTSGGIDHAQAMAKYEGLADALSRALNQRVRVVLVREFAQLEQGMRSERLDFVFARPTDYPARGVRDHGYRFVASGKPEGQCLIVVPRASPATSLAQLKGQRWVLPEKASYMAKFCAAELRDQGILVTQEQVQYVREQGAIAYFLANGFGDAGGVASYSGVAKALEKSGLKVLHRSRAQPYFPLIASRRFTPAQVSALQAVLGKLTESDAGRALLKRIGIEQFETSADPKRLHALLAWLER